MRIYTVERLWALCFICLAGFAIVNFASLLSGGRAGGRCYYLRFAEQHSEVDG